MKDEMNLKDWNKVESSRDIPRNKKIKAMGQGFVLVGYLSEEDLFVNSDTTRNRELEEISHWRELD